MFHGLVVSLLRGTATADLLQHFSFQPFLRSKISQFLMDPVYEKLEQSRRELLDLGLRNPLLNYREFKSRGVHVIDEQPSEVFRILVDEGRRVGFLPCEFPAPMGPNGGKVHPTQPFVPPDDPPALDRKPNRRREISLRTPYPPEELERRLLKTYYAARTALEEQGINVLFLALGMLLWQETQASDVLRKAPLVLIPVKLSRASVRSGFKLDYTGDEIDTNLPLQMKFKADYGLELPATLENKRGLDLEVYFNRVVQSVSSLPHVHVDSQAIVLGFFSFSKLRMKLRMYKDLDPSNWPMECQPADHPILRSLLHEGFAADNVELPPLSGENDNLSAFAPPLTSTTLCSVLDADSSQASAILQVKAGRSFVIQGPPGTGKSQTITNLIAESIAEGKTVLFVAEKMAALEVVKRRLDHVGLNSAYLEFHSHKTNKQAFLQELQRTLQLSQPRHQEREQLIRELKSAHDRLERYYKALLAPVGQSAGFPYWLYGQWSQIQQRLQDIVVPPVAHAWVEILGRWSDSDYQERRSKVQELQLHLHQMGEPRQHPFWGSRRKRLLLPLDQQELTRKLQLALEYLDNLQQAAERLAVICDARVPDDPKTLGLWMATAQHALQAPDLAAVAIEHPEWRNGKDVLRKIIALGRQVQESYEHFEPLLRPEAWQADVEVVHQVLLKHGSKSWRFLVPTYWRVRRTLRAFYRVPPPRRHEHILQTVNVIRLFQYWETYGSLIFRVVWRNRRRA